MNKHTALLGVLGLTVLETHSSVMPFSKSHVRLTEEQLDSIESSLAANDVAGLNTQIENLTETVATNAATLGSIDTAIAAAFTANGLELPEGTSATDAIATLSTKCKEYGESANTHSLFSTDGIDKDDKNESANYAHNQILNENKFKTLK